MISTPLLVAIATVIPAVSPVIDVEQRPAHEFRRAVHDALRQQATTSGAEQEAAVHELLALYREVHASTQFSEPAQRQLTSLVHNRLQRIQRALQKDAEEPAGPDKPSVPPAQRALLAQIPGIRAAQNPPAAPAAGNLPGQRNAPNQAGGAGDFNAATARNAQNLIELIETTIAPKSWQSAGGLGTIMYFAPSQVLVVRQTDGIHTQVGGAIQRLRGQQP